MAEAQSFGDEPTQLPGSLEGQDAAESGEEEHVLAVPGPPNQFLHMTSPAPRKAPPPPTAYAPPPWLAPPTVDPPFEAPIAPPTPTTPRSRGLGVKEHITLSKLQEYLAVEKGLKQSCQTLPLTIALWISFVLLIFNHGNSQLSFESAQLLRDAMADARVLGSRDGSVADLTLHSITEIDQVLPWVEGALVPMLSVQGLGRGQVRQRQQLLGWVKLAQTRGPDTTQCADLSADLRRFHTGNCHPSSGVALPYGPHATDYSFRPVPNSNNRFDAWLEVGRSVQSVQQRVQFLRNHSWLDLSTQEVVIEAAFLNSEAYIYTHLACTLKLHREGWLQTTMKVKPLRGNIYPHWTFALLDTIWILLLLFLLFRAATQMRRAYKRGLLRLHFEDPYVYVDWVSVIVGLGIAAFYWFQISQLESFESYLSNLGAMPRWSANEAPATSAVQAAYDNHQYEKKLSDMFSYFSTISTMVEYHRLFSFWYTIVIVARYFRGFTGQPRLAVLIQTMMATADFFLHFCVVFVMVFGNFALGGYIIFGEQLENWSTLGQAVSHLFSVLFGEFDYNDFHSVAPISAACWFWFFYVSVVLLLMGLLSAAILDVYLSVRERLGEPGASLPQQVLEYLAEIWWFRTYEGSKKSVPDEVLLEMIRGDTDPKVIERLGRLLVDRRLRTREDLAKAEEDPIVDIPYLVERGCDPQTGERLLERCSAWKHQLAPTSTPAQRLMLLVARQIAHMRTEASRMKSKMRDRNDSAARAVDRLDLKHGKCAALARRIRKAQEVPQGWTALLDEHGRRYLRHEATGLTSWTLPRHLV